MKRLIADVIAGQIPLVARPDISVRAAARLMAERSVGALLMVRDNTLVGIFSERDVMNKVVAAGLDPDQTAVSEVMVRHVVTISPERRLAEALHMMREGFFRHVPVVDAQNRPLGMVSARDALSGDLADFEQEIRRMDEIEEIIG